VDADTSLSTYLGTYLEVVDSCTPGLVEGLYVVGSYALGDWHAGRSDIDIVAITAEAATDSDAAGLVTAHAILAEQLEVHIDGPYLAWADVISPPMSLHRPWSLDGRLHHDGDCFELNPVTWYVLAHHGVTVRGPTVERLGVYLDVDARVRFVVDNLSSYWRTVATDVRDACAREPGRAFDLASFEWCALGALRLHYTAFNGGVISKSAAGEYGRNLVAPQLQSHLLDAVASRQGRLDQTSATTEQMLAAADVIEWCINSVRAAR
jgi:hypothetical protein